MHNARSTWDTAWVLSIAALVLGFAARVALSAYLGSDTIFPDSDYYLENARSVLSGAGYDPGFVRGPLYSYFIAAIFAVSGQSIFAVQVAQGLLWVVIAVLAASIAHDIFRSKVVAAVTVALISLYPFFIAVSSLVISETVFVVCYMTAIWLAYRYRATKRLSIVVLSGLALGLCFLTRSTAIAFMPLLALWFVVVHRERIGLAAVRSAVFVVAFLVIAVPYAVTLREQLGTWTLDGYGTRFLWNTTVWPLYGPVDNIIENADHLTEAQRAEVARYTPDVPVDATFAERNRLYNEMIVKYVRENPGEYVLKLGRKFLNNFTIVLRTNTNPAAEQWWVTDVAAALILAPTYALFFGGLWLCRRRLIELGPLLIVVAVSVAIFTIYQSRVRYTLSIVPAMTPLLAFALERAVQWCRARLSVRGQRLHQNEV